MALLGIPQGTFVWGRGGQRVTPDQIAQQQDFAQQQRMAGMDFSPVGSVWEGLGRVASGFLGGQRMRRADAESARNAEESQNVIAQLLAQPKEGADSNAVIASAVSNPYISDIARQIALQQHQRLNPEPVEDKDSIVRLSRIANDPTQPGWLRRDAQSHIDVLNDPLSVITNSAGTQILPRSTLLNMGGGDPASGGGGMPSAPVGRLTPIEPNIGNTPAPQLDGNGMPQALSAAQYQAVVNQMGKQATDAWIARNNIPVGN